MSTQNHTPINHIIQKHAAQAQSDTTTADTAITPQPLQHVPSTATTAPSPKPAAVSISPESAPIKLESPADTQDLAEEAKIEDSDAGAVETLDSGLSEFSPLQEAVEHSIEDDEVKEFVEERKENVQVSSDLQQAGVEPVQTTQFPAYQSVKLPISDEQVMEGLHQPKSSSFRWLAEFAMYLLKKAHITLKTVHGHVVRVMKK